VENCAGRYAKAYNRSMNRWDADIEKVSRSLLRYVRRKGEKGDWVPAKDAFKAAIKKHSALEWAHYIEIHPKAKIVVTSAVEKLMKSEFRDIKRKKRGTYRGAPVFFRVRR